MPVMPQVSTKYQLFPRTTNLAVPYIAPRATQVISVGAQKSNPPRGQLPATGPKKAPWGQTGAKSDTLRVDRTWRTEAGKGWLAQRFGVQPIPRRRQQAIQRTHGARKCGLPWATSQRSGRRSHTGSSRLLTSARATKLAFRAATCPPHARVLLLCVLTAQACGGTGVYKRGKSRGEHLGSKGRSRRAARTYQRSRCSIPPALDCWRTSSFEQRELEPTPRPSLPCVRCVLVIG